jgi:hypothetical protein
LDERYLPSLKAWPIIGQVPEQYRHHHYGAVLLNLQDDQSKCVPEGKSRLAILDTLWAVLVSPSDAFAFITRTRPLWWALLAGVAVALMSGFVLVPNPPELAEVIIGLGKGTLPGAPAFAFWVAFFLLAVAIQAAIVHTLALIMGGKGRYAGIFCGICFAYFPGLLAAPLALLRAVMDSLYGHIIYNSVFALLCIWIVILAVIATKHNYGLSTTKATAACLLTGFLFVVLPLVVVTIWMAV